VQIRETSYTFGLYLYCMKMTYRKKNRLLLPAVFTAAGIMGILGLQVYWLVISFSQQESRFKADVENALSAAAIKISIGLKAANEIPGNEIPDSILQKKKSALALTAEPRNIDPNSFTVVTSYTAISQTLSRPQLDSLKKMTAEELRKSDIDLPVELAAVDNGQPYLATCDIAEFNKLSVSYDLTDNVIILTSYKAWLRAAFPNANLYLLRRMALILSVSAFLILLCALSLFLLIRFSFRQKRIADIRNDFMNNMTHELKTPISSVSVALQMMSSKEHPMDKDVMEEYFSIAQGELKRLNMLAEKVLKMAAFEKSEVHISPGAFMAIPWLKDIISGMRPVFEAEGAKVTMDVEPDSLMLYADKEHLASVIQNFLENALKYNDKVVPVIQLKAGKEDDGTVVLTVKDNGKGIPAAYLSKVFDKFFRVPAGDLHEVNGYGLGLSYVKAIAELHKGTVTVDSVPGEGSAFSIRLPQRS